MICAIDIRSVADVNAAYPNCVKEHHGGNSAPRHDIRFTVYEGCTSPQQSPKSECYLPLVIAPGIEAFRRELREIKARLNGFLLFHCATCYRA